MTGIQDYCISSDGLNFWHLLLGCFFAFKIQEGILYDDHITGNIHCSCIEADTLDWILEAEELVQGLLDTMYAIQSARQDVLIPVTILSTFEAVLKRVHLLHKEVETSAKI